jgi:hypothetical protein
MLGIANLTGNEASTPVVSHLDKAQLTPSLLRFLLGRYNCCIKPRYSIHIPELLNHDGNEFKKLDDTLKFKVLMACAIAAAHESYKSPNWRPLMQVCREWASELIDPTILAPEENSLEAILLLLIYELADSSRGAVWELLDLAIRTCLQLGLLRAPQNVDHVNGSHHSRSPGGASVNIPNKIHLVTVLRNIEGCVWKSLLFCLNALHLWFVGLYKQSSTGQTC